MLGVLGGMGQGATNFFIDLLTRSQISIQRDQDYLPTVIYSDTTIPDRTAGILNQGPYFEEILNKLQTGINLLERAKVSQVIILCNTAHYWIPHLSIRTPIVHLMEITIRYIQQKKYHTIGLLCTQGTLKAKLYRFPPSLRIVYPNSQQQQTVSDLIYHFKGDESVREDQQKIQDIMSDMKEQGAQKLILGCTELSVLLHNTPDTINPLALAVHNILDSHNR